MTRKFRPCLQGIQSATGENLTGPAQIADRWKWYCEDLYCDEEGKGIEQKYWEQQLPPLRSEVARAIHQTASRKATGFDEVPAELFKAGGETVLYRMHRICVAREMDVLYIHPTSQERRSETVCKLQNNCSCLPCKQNPSSDHTGKDPSEDQNGNCR